MLIVDQLCKDALSLAVKSAEKSQGEVKCMWFFRKLRKSRKTRQDTAVQNKRAQFATADSSNYQDPSPA